MTYLCLTILVYFHPLSLQQHVVQFHYHYVFFFYGILHGIPLL